MNQNNKKSIYTVIGIIAIVVIILITKALSGSNAEQDSKSSMATSTASTTVSAINTTNSVSKTVSNKGKASTAIAPTLTDAEINATVRTSYMRVPTTGIDVTLANGGASFTDGATKGKIEMGPIYSKVATNDGYDVFVGMNLTDTERLSSLNYVALFHVSNKTVRYSSAVLVGDRLPVVAVVASPEPKYPYVRVLPYMDSTYGYRLTINYLGRKNLEPITAQATVASDLIVNVKNHIVSR